MKPPLLVFLHIPKTAGTTLAKVLSTNEPGARTRRVGNVFKGNGGIDRGLIARFRENGIPDLGEARILTGHVPLGIREHLPKDRDVRCLTFLREPVERTVSHYFQIREKHEGGPPGPKSELPPLPAKASVDDALEAGYLYDNLQTRMLSGLAEPFGEVTDEMLEQAKQSLREELAFFGLAERFDESLLVMQRRLGFRAVLYQSGGDGKRARKANRARKATGRVNPTRPRGDQIPKELRRAAEDCNRYDIELYRYAEELFDSAPERAQLEFAVELAALRAAKADGEVEVEAPAPEGFGGDEEAWGMLLEARATFLRQQQELAEIKALAHRLGERFQGNLEEILERLERVREAQERHAARRKAARARADAPDGGERRRKAPRAKKARGRERSTRVEGHGGKAGKRRRKAATSLASG